MGFQSKANTKIDSMRQIGLTEGISKEIPRMIQKLRVLVAAAMMVFALYSSQGALAANYPAASDLRPYLTPVKDQLFRGSCATFASLAAMEYFQGVPRLSETYAYATLKREAAEFDGATLQEMANFLNTTPMVAEEHAPYENLGSFGFDANNANEAEVARRINRSLGARVSMLRDRAIFQAVGARAYNASEVSLDWIKYQIAVLRRPVVIGMQMSATHWMKARGGVIDGVFHFDEQGRLDFFPDEGGHAVLVVGYTADNRLIIRNSWGVKWGDKGHGYFAWHYVNAKLISAMTLDSVETRPHAVNADPKVLPELVTVRSNAYPNRNGNFDVYLSLVLRSNTVPYGGIKDVDYFVYDPYTEIDLFEHKRQKVKAMYAYKGVRPNLGFFIALPNFPHRALQVCVATNHYKKTFFGREQWIFHPCMPIHEILSFSSQLILERGTESKPKTDWGALLRLENKSKRNNWGSLLLQK